MELKQAVLAVESFPGVERRFQLRGRYADWLLLDDYAHHPTEIRATVSAARERFPDYLLTVAFQPHQIQRTERLMSEFADALRLADRVFVLPVFAARETADQRVISTSQQLVQQGLERGAKFQFCPTLDQLRLILDDKHLTGPETGRRLFLTLGAGDIDRIFYELPGQIR